MQADCRLVWLKICANARFWQVVQIKHAREWHYLCWRGTNLSIIGNAKFSMGKGQVEHVLNEVERRVGLVG